MAWELLVGYVGSMFPDQGLNPGPSNWEHKVLAPGEGNGTPLQYSCLENPMDGGAWWAAVIVRRYESDLTERPHFHFSLSCIREGNGNPLQCSCLENRRDGGAWWAAVYGVAQSRTRLKRLSSSSRSVSPWTTREVSPVVILQRMVG